MGISLPIILGSAGGYAGATGALGTGVGLVGGALAGASVGLAGSSYLETTKARKQAEDVAAQQRAALALEAAKPVPALPDEQAIAKARRGSIIAQMRRRGRAGSILTDTTPTTGDTLGA